MGKVKPKHWNTKKQRVKAPRAKEPENDHVAINGRLGQFLAETNVQLWDLYFETCREA